MMAMSFKRDVDKTSLPATKTAEETSGSDGAFRSSDQADSEPKMPLHSGLSALIQAATSQLGQIDEATTTTTITTSKRSSSRRNSTLDDNNNTAAKAPPPRYTPHGFHTTPCTTTAMSFQDGYAPPRFSSSLSLNTSTLGPEAAAEVRRQTFPEILMTVLEDNTNADVITFLPDGKFFAVRRKEFSETTMMNYFSVSSFEDFLTKIHNWGFSRIDRGVSPSGCLHNSGGSSHRHTRSVGIEIFRHPMFVKGDWEKCSRICFGESPTEVRLSALPDRARIEYTLSDESTLTASKRRLSPSHTRKESESSTTTSKQRLSADAKLLLHPFASASSQGIPAVCESESAETHTSSSADASTAQDQGLQQQSQAAAATAAAVVASHTEDDVRSIALAITTEKLNLMTDVKDHVETSTPLVEQAVENATHTIVTDAIETLLRDEGHTRETYLKHEEELSRSSLPGVVPISKQLFSPPDAGGTVVAKAIGGQQQQQQQVQQRQQQQQQRRDSCQDPPAPTGASLFQGMRTRSAARRSSLDPPAANKVLASNSNTGSNVGIAMSTTSST